MSRSFSSQEKANLQSEHVFLLGNFLKRMSISSSALLAESPQDPSPLPDPPSAPALQPLCAPDVDIPGLVLPPSIHNAIQ